MNRFPHLLCLAALTGAMGFAQTTVAKLPSDPMLAAERTPAMQQSSATQPDDTWSDGTQANGSQTTAAKPSAARRAQSDAAHVQSGAQSNAAPRAQSNAAGLQAEAISPAQPQLQPRGNVAETVLPVATVLRLKLVRPVSTATARPGEKFFATSTGPVVVDGRTIIPSGTSVTCRVDGAHAGRRLAGKPSLTIRAVSVQLPSGEVLDFTASVIDTATPHKLDVDQEGRVRGATFNPMDKVETGSLAGAGLIAGAVIAGPEGLFIGAASGAAIAAGHVLVKHKDLTLPAGTELIFELDAPATSHGQAEASM